MRPEYDFSIIKGAVRGKYAKALRAGHNIVIHNEEGTTLSNILNLKKGQFVDRVEQRETRRIQVERSLQILTRNCWVSLRSTQPTTPRTISEALQKINLLLAR